MTARIHLPFDYIALIITSLVNQCIVTTISNSEKRDEITENPMTCPLEITFGTKLLRLLSQRVYDSCEILQFFFVSAMG